MAPICLGVWFSKKLNVLILLRRSFWYIKSGVLIWFHLNLRNFNPRNFHFLASFSLETIFPLLPSVTTLISEDVEFYCASFEIFEKFVGECPSTQTPTQKLWSQFLKFSSEKISSSWVSLEMIFEALQSELFRFKFHSLGLKIFKNPGIQPSYILFYLPE